jgi:RNA polymerase sigma-70 factor (ECF subfamily)
MAASFACCGEPGAGPHLKDGRRRQKDSAIIFFADAESFARCGSSLTGECPPTLGEVMNAPNAGPEIERLFSTLRPKLHRYCARMTGSAVDGEDVVQSALVKAIEAVPRIDALEQPEAWLFRIAHNAALDFLRGRARRETLFQDLDPETIEDSADPIENRQAVAMSLHTLMGLPPLQRSAVVLMDVLGYSLQEIAVIIDTTVPAVKAALHRGRGALRHLAETPVDSVAPPLAEPLRVLLATYVDRFNARDFDAIRSQLAEEVRLDLVTRLGLAGRSEVSRYFTNYSGLQGWRLVAGTADGRPAALVYTADAPEERPSYFILLQWSDGKLIGIRDFYYARYASESAVLVPAI